MYRLCSLLPLLIALQLHAQKGATANTTDPRLAGLDATFTQVLRDWRAPGFAVAVVEKNKVIYARGFGYRDMAQQLPVTPETLFAIGSCTKAFTAALVGLQRQEGKVTFDEPVYRYMPGLRFYNDALTQGVTLRQMMSHTTGLPRHDFSWYFFSTASRDTILQRLQYQEPTYGLRERWQYNNFMFTAQGALVEKLTGKSWEENIRTSFFGPLEMKRSRFSARDLRPGEEAALGYRLKRDTLIDRLDYYDIVSMGPAGSIYSSVSEMTAWLQAWINGGKYKGREILPASYITEAISSQAVVSPGVPARENPDVHFANYGFGWMLSSYRGHYRVEHGGNIDGFSASTSFFPTDSIGIVVLVNQNSSSVPSVVRNILSDRLLGLKAIDWNRNLRTGYVRAQLQQKAARRALPPVPNTRSSHPPSDFAGSYHHPGYGTIRVRTQGDSLLATLGQYEVWLRHFHYDVFEPFLKDREDGIDTTDRVPWKFQFTTGMNGDVEALTVPFEAGLKPLVFERRPEVKPLAKNELEVYTGSYLLAGAEVKVYTRGTTLFVFVPGQPDFELEPNGAHKFALKVAKGYFVQFDLEGGQAKSMTFVQPNGNFKATRKM